ncbi:helix-turn-helix domain-containing protein [Oryzibacter oryziterrae]|uniref:helix-turn-helix domain-containing protein n=1 Tax=Oryzibacter oryziterrae TaxID=2766474 RepID=UPI001F3873FA|nr:helix-turn-helix domain-containing protein [Oryzibacter oryziterrae]
MIDFRARQAWFNAVLACPDLPPTVRLVATALGFAMHVGNGQCFPSYETLGAKCAMSARTAMRAVQALEASGWLGVARTKGRRSNTFTLLMPSDQQIEPDQSGQLTDLLALGSTAIEDYAAKPAPPNSDKAMSLLPPGEPCQSFVTVVDGQQCQTAHPTVTELCHPKIIENIPPYNPPIAQPSKVNDAFELLCEIWSDDIGDRGRARTAFHRAVTALTVDPDKIIEAARERRLMRFTGRALPPEALAQWLRREGWSALPSLGSRKHERPSAALSRVFVEEGSEAWRAWVRYRQANGQSKPPATTFAGERGRRGWHFPSEMPPTAKLGVN